MDRNFRNFVEKGRAMKVRDLDGHELDIRPTIYLPRDLDNSYLSYARRAGLDARYDGRSLRDIYKYGVLGIVSAGHENQTRREFIRKAGKGLVGVAVLQYLTDDAGAQQRMATVKISGGAQYYNWQKTILVDEFDEITDDLYMIGRLNDPEAKFTYNPNSSMDPISPETAWTEGDKPMEKLDLMKWMHYDQNQLDCGTGEPLFWQETPINLFLDLANAPQGQNEAAQRAMRSPLIKEYFKEVNFDPFEGTNTGVRFKWNAESTGYARGGNICLPPTKGTISIKNVDPHDVLFWQKVILHELGHALQLLAHSPSRNHIMFKNDPSVNDYPAIEAGITRDIDKHAHLGLAGKLYPNAIYDFSV